MMAKQTFDDYLFQGIQDLDFDGTVQLNWDQQAHVFEVNFTMSVANSGHVDLEWTDATDDQPFNDDVVDYEDGVLFFDQNRLNGADYSDDYLTMLPFDGKKGLSQAVLDAFLTSFQEALDDGESDLMDFLDADSTAETFVLKWPQQRFTQLLADSSETAKTTFLPYPSY